MRPIRSSSREVCLDDDHTMQMLLATATRRVVATPLTDIKINYKCLLDIRLLAHQNLAMCGCLAFSDVPVCSTMMTVRLVVPSDLGLGMRYILDGASFACGHTICRNDCERSVIPPSGRFVLVELSIWPDVQRIDLRHTSLLHCRNI